MTSTNDTPGPVRHSADGARIELTSPTAMPRACGFLWNPRLLLQVNCRGYVTAQHMQPEAAKYAHGPVLEQKIFMQPEHQFYAHHPGRFIYVRDVESGELFSLPYEPVRRAPDAFVFALERDRIEWRVENLGLDARLSVSLPAADVVEVWDLELTNPGAADRELVLCSGFSIGYMSWMNQSAAYDADLQGIVARSIPPYQKLADYPHSKAAKGMTFLVADREPAAWEASLEAFEGEGGIGNPDGAHAASLGNGEASYEIPIGALQFPVRLQAGATTRLRLLFGPAHARADIAAMRSRYLAPDTTDTRRRDYAEFLARGDGCLAIDTPDAQLDDFVNHWLGRQVYYLGTAHRMTTDPQTRNYLQDAIGMVYVDPAATRESLLRALGQQRADGCMPDGIFLADGVDLTYINQVPHTDHSVWLPVCLEAYLDETADYALLDERVTSTGDGAEQTVLERVTAAMRWLIGNCDDRGLSLIAQGDWCDPMNMVGHLGKGVSGWLTIATVHALRLWATVCRDAGQDAVAQELADAATFMSEAAQRHLWDGRWFARGISDNGTRFGVHTDDEGRIYLNPQSWALLADIASEAQAEAMIAAIEEHLATPFGTELLAPAYTSMVEHIGRLTQKHPGVGENGSVYNHASLFYVFALLRRGDAGRAFRLLRQMIPGPGSADYLVSGQLPAFVPTYYRGDGERRPRTAGRSSQLFNTGAASWMYRCFAEGVFGLRGTRDGLRVDPVLPPHWDEATVRRRFRDADYRVHFVRANVSAPEVRADGRLVAGGIVPSAPPGATVDVEVRLPSLS